MDQWCTNNVTDTAFGYILRSTDSEIQVDNCPKNCVAYCKDDSVSAMGLEFEFQ
jgi:hypothetical protein